MPRSRTFYAHFIDGKRVQEARDMWDGMDDGKNIVRFCK